jgi:hypothetical protein
VLTVAAIRAYLQSRGITDEIVDGLDERTMPDRLVYIVTGGAGELRERVFERVTVQAICRGAQNDLSDAEALADAVDRAFMDVIYPVSIGGRHVPSIQWAGGGPALIDRDDARRSLLSATYVVEVAR